jgi:hypothetical protein
MALSRGWGAVARIITNNPPWIHFNGQGADQYVTFSVEGTLNRVTGLGTVMYSTVPKDKRYGVPVQSTSSLTCKVTKSLF